MTSNSIPLSDRDPQPCPADWGAMKAVDGERTCGSAGMCGRMFTTCRHVAPMRRAVGGDERWASVCASYKRAMHCVNSNCRASGGPVPPRGGPLGAVRIGAALSMYWHCGFPTRTNQRDRQPNPGNRSQRYCMPVLAPPDQPAKNNVDVNGIHLFRALSLLQPSRCAVMGK